MKLKIIIVLAVLILITCIGYFHLTNKGAWNTAYTWSGIKNLPTWASDQRIEVKGSMFSREFVITFRGTKDQIENWVRAEPVLQGIEAEEIDDSNIRYILKPQGGAQWAEINIDKANSKVTIRTYWS